MKYINIFDTEESYNSSVRTLARPQLAYISSDSKIYSLSGIDTDMVDMGLSVNWASCNIGATCGSTKESWFGNYYAWGETEAGQKTKYRQDNYKFGTDTALTKYNSTDNKMVLDSEDDVAMLTQNLRIPSQSEFTELKNNTTTEWKTDYNGISGLNGMLFTSNINGNTLFIPAADYWYEVKITSGTYAKIWLCNLSNDDKTMAHVIDAHSITVSALATTHRYYGIPVRGVAPR